MSSKLGAIQIAKLGLVDDTLLAGFEDNPFAWMRGAAVFVLSSALEGFGNVVVEAIACGVPIVSTNCPSGPSEILEGGKWGTLVPVGDAAALASAIALTLDADEQPDVARRAKAFDVDAAVEGYLSLIA